MSDLLKEYRDQYTRDGYITAVPIIDSEDALKHRRSLEVAEGKIGSLHYKSKVHTILTSPYALAILPAALDIAEQFIGQNILLYNVTYIIKEANTITHVSWHQDLTYWGLSHDDQVSMWLALSPATQESGCMRMIPGSHLRGCLKHETTRDDNNVLLQGQTVPNTPEDHSVLCPLAPGEASFHHGWTLHASLPNNSPDRRIGLNVQYLATHVKQTKHDLDSAMLVRGVDEYKNFSQDQPAGIDLDPAAVRAQIRLEERYVSIAGN